MKDVIIGGRYRHYKGDDYVVLCVGRSSENPNEEFVVYQGQYDHHDKFGPNPIWIRPKKMFLETILIKGKELPRFVPIEA